MNWKVFGWAAVAFICILLFYNHSGLSWIHLSDLSGPEWKRKLSLFFAACIAVPVGVLGVMAVMFLAENLKQAVIFGLALVMFVGFWIVMLESKGEAIMNNDGVMYVIVIFMLCFGPAAAIAIKAPDQKK